VSVKIKILKGSDGVPGKGGWESQFNNSLSTSTIARNLYGDVTAGAISVVNNGDGSFKITNKTSASANSTGSHNNTIENQYYYYTIDTAWPSGNDTSKLSSTLVNTSVWAGFNKVIRAKRFVDGKYNNVWTSEASNTLTFTRPTAPSTPIRVKKTRSRYTLKENWTLEWDEAQAGSAAVAGYILYAFATTTDGQYKSLILYDGNGNKLHSGTTGPNGEYNYYIVPSQNINTISSLTFYTEQTASHNGIGAGDTISFKIYPYSKNFKGNIIMDFDADNSINSAAITIENAGVVDVRVGSEWKEGQVYVYTGSGATQGWKEAESVSVYTANGWKESQ
jgi:hypothetical protein